MRCCYAETWISTSVRREFDGTRRIGNRRCGRMPGGKASDVHVNVDTESKTWSRVSCRTEKTMREHTWPDPIGILNLTFASIVPIDPYGILASVSENIIRERGEDS